MYSWLNWKDKITYLALLSAFFLFTPLISTPANASYKEIGCYCVNNDCDPTKQDCSEQFQPGVNQGGCDKNIDSFGIGRSLTCRWEATGPVYIDYCCCKEVTEGNEKKLNCVDAQNTEQYKVCNEQVYTDFNTELDKLGTCECTQQVAPRVDATSLRDCSTNPYTAEKTCYDFKFECRDTDNFKNCRWSDGGAKCFCDKMNDPKVNKITTPEYDEQECIKHVAGFPVGESNCVWKPGYERNPPGYGVKPDDGQQCSTYNGQDATGQSGTNTALSATLAKYQSEAEKLNKVSYLNGVKGLIGRVISFFLFTIGSFSFVLYLYAGVLWMTAAGNSEQTQQAKNIFLWTSLGLVALFGSYVVISQVIQFVQTGGTI